MGAKGKKEMQAKARDTYREHHATGPKGDPAGIVTGLSNGRWVGAAV